MLIKPIWIDFNKNSIKLQIQENVFENIIYNVDDIFKYIFLNLYFENGS